VVSVVSVVSGLRDNHRGRTTTRKTGVQGRTTSLEPAHAYDPIRPLPTSPSEKNAEVWVDARAVAACLGVSRDYVYANAARLGARRLGAGTRARLRFQLETVLEALTPCESDKGSSEPNIRTVARRKRVQPAPVLGSGVALLPIRGRNAV
jgi:hypothetical protein